MAGVPLIAIVDDDEAVRLATARLVRSIGYKAQPYASAVDFLQDYARRKPACLITDIQMPEMSGVELQEALNAAGESPPIIFITAFPNDAIRERVLAAGAFCFLSKPCDGDTIVRCVEDAVRSHRLGEETQT
jgi:FixJ family two-component response regulator